MKMIEIIVKTTSIEVKRKNDFDFFLSFRRVNKKQALLKHFFRFK